MSKGRPFRARAEATLEKELAALRAQEREQHAQIASFEGENRTLKQVGAQDDLVEAVSRS